MISKLNPIPQNSMHIISTGWEFKKKYGHSNQTYFPNILLVYFSKLTLNPYNCYIQFSRHTTYVLY